MELLKILWILSPLVLFPALLRTRKKSKACADLLKRLYLRGRVSENDLMCVRVDVPEEIPIPDLVPVEAAKSGTSFAQSAPLQKPAEQYIPAQKPEKEKYLELLHDGTITQEEFLRLTQPQHTESGKAEPAAESAPEVTEHAKPVTETAQEAAEHAKPVTETAQEAAKAAEKAVKQPEQSSAGQIAAADTEEQSELNAIRRVQAFRAAEHPEAPRREKRFRFGRISAITVMLAVGVVLIVLAGILFVRTSWNEMGDAGKLVTLAMGSVLFFGTAALAHRVFRLERTSMAFFTLGAAFLPISFWAAGVFQLLGSGLSGADNRWLMVLSVLMFTGICLIAVRIYRKQGWAIGVLIGGTVAYLYFVAALTRTQTADPVLLAAAVLAVVLAFSAERISSRLTEQLSGIFVPFAVCYTVAAGAAMFVGTAPFSKPLPCGIAALLSAAAFFAPAVTRTLRQGTGPAVGVLTLLCSGLLFTPLRQIRDASGSLILPFCAYCAVFCTAAAVCAVLLLLTGRLPNHVSDGFRRTADALTGLAFAAQLYAVSDSLTLPMLAAELLLLAMLAAAAMLRAIPEMRQFAAGQAFLLSVSSGFFAAEHLTDAQAFLLAAVLLLGFFAAFRFMKKLRTPFSDDLLGISALLTGHLTLCYDLFDTWVSGGAIAVLSVLLLLTAAGAWQTNTRRPAVLAAGQAFLLSVSSGFLSAEHLTDAQAFLLAAVLLLGFFAAFRFVKKLRTPFSDYLLGISALLTGHLTLSCDTFDTWISGGAAAVLSVLLLLTAAGAWQTESVLPAVLAAGQAFLLSVSSGFFSAEHLTDAQAFLLAAVLLLGFFAAFRFMKKLRTPVSDILLGVSALIAGHLTLCYDLFDTWVSGGAIAVLSALLLLTAAGAWQTESVLPAMLAAGQAFLLSVSAGSFAAFRLLNAAQASLLSAALLLGFFAAFRFVKKLRTPVSDNLLGLSAMIAGHLVLSFDAFRTWLSWGGVGILAALLLLTVQLAWNAKADLPAMLAAGQGVLLCCSASYYAVPVLVTPAQGALLAAGLLTVCFAGFYLTQPLRTGLSDVLFPVSALIGAEYALILDVFRTWVGIAATALSISLLILMYLLAVSNDRTDLPAGILAAAVPVGLFALMVSLRLTLPEKPLIWREAVLLGWSAVSCCTAAVTERTTRHRFHAVRQTLFYLTAIPPLAGAMIALGFFRTDLYYVHQLVCILFAVWLWRMLAGHGFRTLSGGAFTVCVTLLCLTTGQLTAAKVFEGKYSFAVYMAATVWIVLFSAAAILIRRRMLVFVGREAIPDVMQVLTPAAAILLSFRLLIQQASAWHTLFWLYAAGLCILSFLLSKKNQLLLPAVSVFALFVSLEALRVHLGHARCRLRLKQLLEALRVHLGTSDATFVLMLFCYTGLVLIFSYLGSVLRADEERIAENPRAGVLTASGGLVMFWMFMAICGLSGVRYSHVQVRWLYFFILMLLSGYVLHFTRRAEFESRSRQLKTVSAALFTVGLWVQPLISVRGGYWEGKLHLIPLLLFGAAIRKLYGEKTGSGFFFATSIYSMIRLAVTAMASHRTADLVTVLFAALLIFVISFYLKQKKWFLLGGVSLIGIAVYLRIKLFPGMQWWVWLLMAGILLIIVAAANEMLKQRGETLKSRAGRFWEDWEW